MAYPVANSQIDSTGGTTTTLGFTPTIGNILVVLITTASTTAATTPTDSKLNTYVAPTNGSGSDATDVDSAAIFYAKVTATGASIVLTHIANATVIIAELAGIDSTNPLNIANNGTAQNTAATISLAATGGRQVVAIGGGWSNGTIADTPGGAYSKVQEQIDDVSNERGYLQIGSAVAAGTLTFNYTVPSTGWVMAAMALNIASSGGMTVGNFAPGKTWIRRYGWVERNRTRIWYNQGIDDIPQQMNVSTFRPGPAWVQRFGKNERRIFLPAISGFVAWLQNLADSVASSDSIVNHPTLNKSDTVTSSDSPVKNVTLNKSDTATTSDSISNRPTLNKADSVTSSDTIVKSVSKALSDSVTSSESISKAPTKKLADSVTSSDSLTTKAVVKNLTDSVTLVETLLLTEGNLTEAVGPPNAFTFHINDSVTSSELISTTTVYKRSLADVVTATESISNQPTKHLSDSAATTESISKAPTLNKSDSVATSDATVKNVVLNKTDTAISSDSISNQSTKKLADSVTATDSLVKSLVKSLTDSVTSSDALSKAIGLNRSDSVSLADAISNRFTKNLSDVVVSTDSSLRYLNGVLVTGSTSALTDSVITTDGEIVLRLAGQEQQFIRLSGGRWALRVGKKLYMVL